MSLARAWLDYIDEVLGGVSDEAIEEARAKRIVSYRGGKRKRRKVCPPGFKLVDGKYCKRMGAGQRRKLSIIRKRQSRKMKGKRHAINRKRMRTMAKRRRAGL
jgi:hypothetical protein